MQFCPQCDRLITLLENCNEMRCICGQHFCLVRRLLPFRSCLITDAEIGMRQWIPVHCRAERAFPTP